MHGGTIGIKMDKVHRSAFAALQSVSKSRFLDSFDIRRCTERLHQVGTLNCEFGQTLRNTNLSILVLRFGSN